MSPKLTVDRMNRINRTRSHYALGLDLGYNKDITMNFHEYQEQQKNRYLEIFQRYYPDVKIINGDLSIEEQFYLVRITLEEFKISLINCRT